MDNLLYSKLIERNKRIIDAVIEKGNKVCPDSIALIGIAGSFCSGDIYEKSDLDLLIVINDDKGWSIGKCFILEDVAHDIYCTPWSRLEEMAEYNNPHITKLFNLEIVYCADKKYLNKYKNLSEKAKKIIEKPFDKTDLEKVKKHYNEALKNYGQMMLEDKYEECKYLSANIIISVEYIIYMINKKYIRRGIKRIPEEINKMNKLPELFNEHYFQVINADNVQDIKVNTSSLLSLIKKYLRELEKEIIEKTKIDKNSILGSYEEVFSNWRNKMYYAADKQDTYLSFMTTASCQEFYNEMYEEFDIDRVDVMKGFNVNDLDKSAKNFDLAMERYKQNYDKLGINVVHYNSIEEFEKDYLK